MRVTEDAAWWGKMVGREVAPAMAKAACDASKHKVVHLGFAATRLAIGAARGVRLRARRGVLERNARL